MLGQSFLHCPIFPTAASRRSLDRISVPMWPFTLSGRLPIVGLVGRYLTNYHNGTRAHLCPVTFLPQCDAASWSYSVLAPISKCYPDDRGRLLTRYSPVRRYMYFYIPLDLHVLSTPPAFVLSQNQTLKFIYLLSMLFLHRCLIPHSLNVDCFFFKVINSSFFPYIFPIKSF